MIDIIQIELERKLDKLNKADFKTVKKFQSACMELAVIAQEKLIQYTGFCLTNLIACNTKKIETQKEIARFVWDLERMNFN